MHKGILQRCSWGDLLLPLLPPYPGSSETCTHVDAHTHTPLTHFLFCAFPILCPEHPSHSSLYLNPTGPAKSHISPLLKSQLRARSSLESLQYFHPAKLSPLSSSDLTKKAPLILSSLIGADVCNSETTSGFCYLYMQTLNSLKSGTVS